MKRRTKRDRYRLARVRLFNLVCGTETCLPGEVPRHLPHCQVCGRPALTLDGQRPRKGFQVHHIFYADKTPRHSEYVDRTAYAEAMVNYAICLSTEQRVSQLAVLCKRHHYLVEMLAAFPSDAAAAMVHLARRTAEMQGRSTGGSIAARIAATAAALRRRGGSASAARGRGQTPPCS